MWMFWCLKNLVFLLDTFKRKHITGPATLQDVALMEEAGVRCAPPRRLHGKHRAPVVLPPQPPVTKKRPVPKGKAAAKSKTKRREATPPSVEDLVANGHLPEESVERYEGLCAADLDELKEMTQELWLPDHGAVHELALRLVRHLAGLDPLDEAEETEETEAASASSPAKRARAKAAPKRKLRAGKMGAASRVRMGRQGRGGRGGRSGSKPGRGRGARIPKAVKGPVGPSKKKMRDFLTSYLEDVDIQTTTFGQLRAAATEHFGVLSEGNVTALSELAAVAMRKQLGVRRKAAAAAEASPEPEVVEEPVAPPVEEVKEQARKTVVFCFFLWMKDGMMSADFFSWSIGRL